MLIMPKTLAIELSRITIRQIGARYFREEIIQFLSAKLGDCSISFAILSKPTTLVTRKHVASAASGIITEFVIKSKKSQEIHAEYPDEIKDTVSKR